MDNELVMLQRSCPKCNGLGYVEKIYDVSSFIDVCPQCNGLGLIQVVDEKLLKEYIESTKSNVEIGQCAVCAKQEEKYKLVTMFGSKELVCLECAKTGRKIKH